MLVGYKNVIYIEKLAVYSLYTHAVGVIIINLINAVEMCNVTVVKNEM